MINNKSIHLLFIRVGDFMQVTQLTKIIGNFFLTIAKPSSCSILKSSLLVAIYLSCFSKSSL